MVRPNPYIARPEEIFAIARIEIYTTSTCPYCFAAKQLLDRKRARFEEISVDGNPGLRQVMTKRANGRYTVPQIFIGNFHVGGFDDMAALDRRGELDALLRQPA